MRLYLSLALCLSLSACTRDPGTDDDPGTDSSTATDTGTGTETETESETQGFTCQDGPNDAGDWWGAYDSRDVTGTNPYTADAGVAALIAAAPDSGSKTFDPPMMIAGAVVTAASYAPEGKPPSNIWIADMNGAARTRDPDFEDPADIEYPEDLTAIPIGSTVSFAVKSMANYNDELQIDGLKDFTINADAGSKIHVMDLTDGTKVEYDKHGRQVVHLWGEITEVQGACGSPTCYTLTHGSNEYTLRVKLDYLVGDCVELVHTVGVYQGEVQFDVTNWDSVRTF